MATPPPAQGTFLAGTRDPLPDEGRVEVGRVEGAHACQFSNAREVAEALQAGRPA
jgi:hypothetical protein